MTAAYDQRQDMVLLLDLYEHFGVGYPTALGSTAQDDGKRAKIDKTQQYFDEGRHTFKTQKDAVNYVKQKWTVGLGPVASWLMWMAIRQIAMRVTIWLWKRYNS